MDEGASGQRDRAPSRRRERQQRGSAVSSERSPAPRCAFVFQNRKAAALSVAMSVRKGDQPPKPHAHADRAPTQ